MQRELNKIEDYLGPLPHGPLEKLPTQGLKENYLNPFIRNWNNHKHPDFIFTFWPVTEEYYSPLNALYLHELGQFSEAHNCSTILSRDGALPLLWFFENNPVPQTKTKLLVHKSLQHFVPKSWRNNVGSYELGNHPERAFKWEKRQDPRTIIIHAIITQNFLTLDYVKKRLDLMFQLIDEKKILVENFECFFIFRDDPYHWVETDKLVCQFMQEITATLKGSVKFYSEKEILNKNTFANSYLFELNQNYFSTDNYINFLGLSRGASLLESGHPQGKFIQLSPFHGAYIKDNLQAPSWDDKTQEYLEKVRGISLIDDKEERKNYWPRDFWLYAKALFELGPKC